MPIPVVIPPSALPITDSLSARGEKLLENFIRAVAHGTTGATLNSPAVTVDQRDTGTVQPLLIDTDKKQLLYRLEMIALAVSMASPSGEAAGTTSGPTTASATFVLIPEMSVVLTTNGGPVLVSFSSSFNLLAADSFDFSIFVDTVEVAASRRRASCATAISGLPGSTQAILSGLAAGSHTFEVKWKAVAGSARAVGTNRSLSVVEM